MPKEFQCPYDGEVGFIEEATVCPSCNTPHHAECWEENGGCTTYGCKNSPEDTHLHQEIESPQSPVPGNRPRFRAVSEAMQNLASSEEINSIATGVKGLLKNLLLQIKKEVLATPVLTILIVILAIKSCSA